MAHGQSTLNRLCLWKNKIENSSLYYEESIDTWFLFTNTLVWMSMNTLMHLGLLSKDLNHWDADNKAVCSGRRKLHMGQTRHKVFLPSYPLAIDLAIFYDAPEGDSTSHMRRHVGLACCLCRYHHLSIDEHILNTLNSLGMIF